MPFGFILLAAVFVAGVLMTRKQTATGYVAGLPVTLELDSIGNGVMLRSDAAAAWLALASAAEQAGHSLTPSGPRAGFRTSEQQTQLVDELGSYNDGVGLAAAVNTSKHQAGIALDVHWDSEFARQWLMTNAHRWYWNNVGDSWKRPEVWHYEYHPELFA